MDDRDPCSPEAHEADRLKIETPSVGRLLCLGPLSVFQYPHLPLDGDLVHLESKDDILCKITINFNFNVSL